MTGMPATQGLVAFLAALVGPARSGWLELRHRRLDGRVHQRFFAAAKPVAAAACATALARSGDVYVGCTPRRERAGGRAAIEQGFALWVDCDDLESLGRLERFEPRPAMLVRTSSRGAHAYWPLERPLAPGELERANRRLAHALGADLACTDASRVLRPPATLNHKYDPVATVTLERFTGERFSAIQITGRLPDAPTRPARQTNARSAQGRAVDPLLSIPPRVYIEALTGREVRRDGKVSCPFHPDRTPSLHCYPDPAAGWACFSTRCSRGGRPNGGDIYDLAGQLWGLSTRGTDFLELRERLQALFSTPASSSKPAARVAP
jgi:RepB DNA-primase from phage plasmid